MLLSVQYKIFVILNLELRQSYFSARKKLIFNKHSPSRRIPGLENIPNKITEIF